MDFNIIHFHIDKIYMRHSYNVLFSRKIWTGSLETAFIQAKNLTKLWLFFCGITWSENHVKATFPANSLCAAIKNKSELNTSRCFFKVVYSELHKTTVVMAFILNCNKACLLYWKAGILKQYDYLAKKNYILLNAFLFDPWDTSNQLPW